jgi:methanogenic corrinoid protein MtbC1
MSEFELEAGPLAGLARQYLDALLRTDRHAASRMILESVEAGAGIKDIYLRVFEASQHEIGRLWQTGQVTVAQEHFCSAATQLIMSQLYPQIFGALSNGCRLVACCVGGELHEIGLRMVADFFEIEGWDTYYLGANTPSATILETLAQRQADILALSITIHYHIGALTELIAALRKSADAATVKILVGGRPFNVAPTLWQKIGADGHAPNALEAVSVGARLVA